VARHVVVGMGAARAKRNGTMKRMRQHDVCRRTRIVRWRFRAVALACLAMPAGIMLWGASLLVHPDPALPLVAYDPHRILRPAATDDASVADPDATGDQALVQPIDKPLPDETRWFNGRPIKPLRWWRMTVTAYSPDERSCGTFADGITASGYSVWTNGMNLLAADTSLLPFGSLLSVDGYDRGNVVPVLDRGAKIKGFRLDVLKPTHEIALQWGVRTIDVLQWQYADGKPDDFTSGW
jgi:3D (Asp-Asp-Asp) domain-containing protein